MALTDLQRQQIVKRCKTASAPQLWTYLEKEDTPAQREALLERMKANGLQPEKITYLEERLYQPDPKEQEEWKAIEADSKVMEPTQLVQKLNEYLTRWEPIKPYHNHIDEVRHMLSSITENADWQNLNRSNYIAILSYLAKYPHSAHFQELDDILWSMVDFLDENALSKFIHDVPQSAHRQEAENAMDDAAWNAFDHTRIGDLETFKETHPQSRHAKEAQDIITSYAKWDEVDSSDIFWVNQFIKDYPSSPFKQIAETTLLTLKEREIDEMRRLVNQYDTIKFSKLVSEGIINIQRLVNEGLITKDSYDNFCNKPVLPDINMDESKSIKECPKDRTDVFFFGIPSTGKTCILMGLLKSDLLSYDSASMGGQYAADLEEYVNAGRVPPSTFGTFTTAIKADVKVRDKNDKTIGIHHLNLIEMSGEEFAFEIVKNPEGKISFEQMGSGATNILKNENRKAVFIILDPTADNRKVKRPIFKKDEKGNKIPTGEFETVFVSQKQMLKKLFNLFEQPENAGIAKLIDSFHFIVTKADLLGDDLKRETRAEEIIRARHNDMIPDIKDWCKDNGINNGFDNELKLYLFSLGKFYIGDIFDYDDTDANRLINAIIKCTIADNPHNSWIEKVKKIFNKPIF